MNQNEKAKFMKIYANVPINIRDGIISVIDGHPITWNVAYLEIKNETEMGAKILKNLVILDIL